MFDIIKNLKENIQKNNMKKLVLSIALGTFCYYTNNAAKADPQAAPNPEENKEINAVLIEMLKHQVEINKAREEIKDYGKKIYFNIKEEKTVTKKEVITFIKSHYPLIEGKTAKEYENDIKIFEQYYHLETKNEEDECTKDNLTEIFWEETIELVDVIYEKEKKKIKAYFKTIIDAEKAISEAFQEYYDVKKKEKKDTQYEDILKEIIDKCCGEVIGDNLQTKFMQNLNNLCENNNIENISGTTSAAIKRRITLNKEIKEGDFISFLKQKIGIEEKKNGPKLKDKKKQEEGCPCCDCF